VGNVFLDLFLANKVSMPEMAHVRRLIEPEVARLAAVNITVKGKHQLTLAQAREFEPVEGNAAIIEVNQKVHRVLAEECGNHFLEAISKSMLKLTHEMVEAVDWVHEELHGPGEHEKVITAVINGHAEAAAQAMAEHLEIFADRLSKMEQDFRAKISRVSES
jgi:GntR family transcriptional repressor for pyruvate dehydrogenase complex